MFSRQNSEIDLPAPLINLGKEMEHKHEARFLGVLVIVDGNMYFAY